MPENKNPLLMTFSDLKVYFGRWHTFRTFTLSHPLQTSFGYYAASVLCAARWHARAPMPG